MFNSFISDLGDKTEHISSKSMDNAKSEGVAGTSYSSASVQRDPEKLNDWTSKGLVLPQEGQRSTPVTE